VTEQSDTEPSKDGAVRPGFWQRRRDKYVAEIQRNRAGAHGIPTWVLAAALLVFIAAWAAVVLLA
jgi:hypothetical protein